MSANQFAFQDVIMRLQHFWAEQGCLIWQPYSEKVGAGTMNPATVLRVLGPEPWNVAYAEPSYRADDGRYGENPNRMQMHTQFQVILKPDPGNPQELYLQSLEAIGIERRKHDIRFVEDNWASPALGAWGLGWEVWLDGLEITQFTYFQQAGGVPLDPISVEITYGLERIVMFLQDVREVWKIDWDGRRTYGDVLLQPEIEHCQYNFDVADVDNLRQMYNLFEAEAKNALRHHLVIPAHDNVLRCSNTFNILDARGAVGVTERASYFARMRDLARQVSDEYRQQRQRLEYPWLAESSTAAAAAVSAGQAAESPAPAGTAQDLLFEIGVEELPVDDVVLGSAQLETLARQRLGEARLSFTALTTTGAPRRLVLQVQGLAPRQADDEQVVKGPPLKAAFDAQGQPTKAAEGFARKYGLAVADLVRRSDASGEYLYAVQTIPGRPTAQVLQDLLPALVSSLSFGKPMRWNSNGVAFTRPIRWFVALFGGQVIPFTYGNASSGRTTRGLRPDNSPAIDIAQAADYDQAMAGAGVVVERTQRRALITQQLAELAATVGGEIPHDAALLDEVTDLVEAPCALLGSFDPAYLSLPREVLITVMKKHQRYFPVMRAGSEQMLPYFITVANGAPRDPDVVRHGNEGVIRARYADAAYFVREDRKKPLAAYNPRLATMTFQEKLGSMLDKAQRLEGMTPVLAERLGLSADETATAVRAAQLSKADLGTQMVTEMTSLQGIMGREYARESGESEAVATAIFEAYLPRFAGDRLPRAKPGLVVGLADRLDSLLGLFSVGLAPTGSADPFGLRRAALGIVANLIEHQAFFSVRGGLALTAQQLPAPVSAQAGEDAAVFVARRLEQMLKDQGLRFDLVDAVLAVRADDPYRTFRTVTALQDALRTPAWPAALTAYARCKRIVRPLTERYPLAPDALTADVSRQLYESYLVAQAQISPDSDADVLVNALIGLTAPINRFFEQVMVMADDPAQRRANLGLLQSIAALADGIVDLSKVQGF
ncbi:MAG: glycine--tRNA ligase subunit beta [Anaerolineae bacterium]